MYPLLALFNTVMQNQSILKFCLIFKSQGSRFFYRIEKHFFFFKKPHVLQLTSMTFDHSGTTSLPNDATYRLFLFESCSSNRCCGNQEHMHKYKHIHNGRFFLNLSRIARKVLATNHERFLERCQSAEVAVGI